MSDQPDWYFIPHPASHRALWRAAVEGTDGQEVDTIFGKAVNIVMPTPADDGEWICDVCNGLIEVFDANGNPIPVISRGSWALCPQCVARAIRLGDLSPSMGELFPGGNQFNACGGRCCRPWLMKMMEVGL